MNENKPGRICAPITFAGVFAILALGIGAGTPAAAQQGQAVPAGSGVPLPDSKWVKRCSGTEADAFCETSFGKMVNFRDKRVWVSVAGLFERADRRDLFMFTPLGSALRPGVAYRVDQSEAKTAQYSVCLQIRGCQAITGVDQGLIDQMKKCLSLKHI